MRKKLYRNLTTLVLMFALAMGTLIGTTMDVWQQLKTLMLILQHLLMKYKVLEKISYLDLGIV